MVIKTNITKAFIKARNDLAKKIFERTNKNGRSMDQVKMDTDCILHEYNQMELIGETSVPTDYWETDYIHPVYGPTDVKFIKDGLYRFPLSSASTRIKQLASGITSFEFCQWIDRPDRPLKTGDEVTYEVLKFVPFTEVLSNVYEESGYFCYRVADVVTPVTQVPSASNTTDNVMTVQRVYKEYVNNGGFYVWRVESDVPSGYGNKPWSIADKKAQGLKAGMAIAYTTKITPAGWPFIETWKEI